MIELDQLTKTFTQKDGQAVRAVDSVSLSVAEGEICVFLGPSGCGKTTTLKMINRLIEPTSGRVLINGEDTTGLNEVDLRRRIGYVIQQIGLFPNMTIAENITVVPRLLGWDKKRCAERAAELMSMVALDRSDQIEVVLQPTMPNVRAGRRLQEILMSLGCPLDRLRLVLNRNTRSSDPNWILVATDATH